MNRTSRSAFIIVSMAFAFWTMYLLSLSAQTDPTDMVLSQLDEATSTPSDTYEPPTITPSDTPTNTYEPPTITPSDTPTNTYEPPTDTPTNTPTATATLNPSVNWLAPIGTITSSNGNPLYQWTDTYPSTYLLWVGRTDNTQIINISLDRSTYCAAGTCSVDATSLSADYWLANGEYQAWLAKEQSGVQTEWQGPFLFTLDVPAPDPIPSFAVSNADTGSPNFSWSAVPNAGWYEIWVGAAAPFWTLQYTGWHTYINLGCALGGTCSYTPNLDLPASAYVWYVRAWGPGGYNTGGIGSWVEGTPFDSSDVPPPAEVSIFGVINVDSGVPTLVWNPPPNSTWYEVWVGTGDPDWTQHYTGWHRYTTLGCYDVGTCSLTLPSALPQGSYTWYIRSWGPGGFNTGGMAGWVEGPAFDVP